nr:hypothetical protein [Caulobacter soli]
MPRARPFDDPAHPGPVGDGVGGKVQHHRQARAQQGFDMGRDRFAQERGMADIIGHAVDPTRIEAGQPAVFAESDRMGRGGQARRQGGFPGGDLAAQHVERGVLRGHGVTFLTSEDVAFPEKGMGPDPA